MAKVERKVTISEGDANMDGNWQYKSTTRNGKSTVEESLLLVATKGNFVAGVVLRHWYKDKEVYENYEDVLILTDEAKSLRDWLVKQLPYSKQELEHLVEGE